MIRLLLDSLGPDDVSRKGLEEITNRTDNVELEPDDANARTHMRTGHT